MPTFDQKEFNSVLPTSFTNVSCEALLTIYENHSQMQRIKIWRFAMTEDIQKNLLPQVEGIHFLFAGPGPETLGKS